MNRIAESIEALTSLLNSSPTDAEAWVELADLYLSQGLYPQAIYSLEEALVLTPNAWNVSASFRSSVSVPNSVVAGGGAATCPIGRGVLDGKRLKH